MLFQIETGNRFNINQTFLTAMYSIVTLCSILIQDIIFWYYFPEKFNMLKYESLYLWNFLPSKEMNSP